jgi:hypothetical protein
VAAALLRDGLTEALGVVASAAAVQLPYSTKAEEPMTRFAITLRTTDIANGETLFQELKGRKVYS